MAYPNLPGVSVTLNDLGLQIAPPPSGPKITLLGYTSNTGITLREPQIVSNLGAAAAALYFSGSSGEKYPGELALAVEEAYGAGAGTVEIVVIGHVTGSAVATIVSPTGTGPGIRYNDLALAYDAIIDRQMDIIVPVGAHADNPTVTGGFLNQLAQFCYKATTEVDNACFGVIGMMPVIHWALAYKTVLTGAAFSGGSSVNAAISAEVALINPAVGDLFFGVPSSALASAWETYASRTGAPATTYYNGVSTPAFPVIWSGYLAGSETQAGVYGNWNNTSSDATAVNPAYWTYFQARDINGALVVDQRGNKADAGSRVSVIGAPLLTASIVTPKLALGLGASPSSSTHITDGSAAFGGLVTSLVPHSAPTNKAITNVSPQKTLSASQANRLTGRRITTFQNRANGFVVSKAVTGGHNVSKYIRTDYVQLSTVRIVDAVVEIIRSIGDRFIGEPNTAPARNAMSAEIDKALRQMKQARALNAYRFFITASPDQQVLGQAQIDLTLVPAFELTNITVNVSLAKDL